MTTYGGNTDNTDDAIAKTKKKLKQKAKKAAAAAAAAAGEGGDAGGAAGGGAPAAAPEPAAAAAAGGEAGGDGDGGGGEPTAEQLKKQEANRKKRERKKAKKAAEQAAEAEAAAAGPAWVEQRLAELKAERATLDPEAEPQSVYPHKEWLAQSSGWSGPLRPHYVAPQHKITDPEIVKPDYAEDPDGAQTPLGRYAAVTRPLFHRRRRSQARRSVRWRRLRGARSGS